MKLKHYWEEVVLIVADITDAEAINRFIIVLTRCVKYWGDCEEQLLTRIVVRQLIIERRWVSFNWWRLLVSFFFYAAEAMITARRQ